MTLYINTGTEVIPVDMEPSDTVQDIKNKLSYMIDPSSYKLTFQGTKLNPEDEIADVGIGTESMLHIKKLPREDIYVAYFSHGEYITLRQKTTYRYHSVDLYKETLSMIIEDGVITGAVPLQVPAYYPTYRDIFTEDEDSFVDENYILHIKDDHESFPRTDPTESHLDKLIIPSGLGLGATNFPGFTGSIEYIDCRLKIGARVPKNLEYEIVTAV